MALYAADGSINVTVVDGSSRTGLYAADGSWNVVVSDGVGFAGVYHPCGAYNVTVLEDGPEGIYATDGSLYVQETPYTHTGGLRVTVVSGSLGVSFTAPLLAFVSATDPDSDNTQDFDATFYEDIETKVVRLVGTLGSATVGAFDIDISNTIDGTEAGNLEASFTTGAIPNGLCAFKCRIEDGSGNALSDWSNTVSKTIDVAEPVLSSPVDTATGQTTGSGTVTTDVDNGTLYFIVSTSSSAPTGTQIKAGQMHTGAAAADSGSQAVSATGVQTITGGFSGLTLGTGYFAHYYQEDAATNPSNIVSGDGFTTDSAASKILLEAGDDILLETGDFLLLEAA